MAEQHADESNRDANRVASAHAPVAHEPAATHEATPGEHAPELGPLDWPAWTAGAVGVALGLITLAALYVSAHPLG